MNGKDFTKYSVLFTFTNIILCYLLFSSMIGNERSIDGGHVTMVTVENNNNVCRCNSAQPSENKTKPRVNNPVDIPVLMDNEASKIEKPQRIEIVDNVLEEPDEYDRYWEEAPELSIVCRMYHESAWEYWNTFAPSYLLFFPHKSWKKSDVVLIFDEESTEDRRVSTILQNIPPYPRIYYEAPPKSQKKTYEDTARGLGYARQMWSNMYADMYTDSEYIAIVDTDSAFLNVVLMEDLFQRDMHNTSNFKARIRGINGVHAYQSWCNSVEIGLGKPCISEFMTDTSFPMVVKRSHFKDMRDYITNVMEADTYDDAHYKMTRGAGKENFSQFDVIFHYLWYFKRYEYSWHIRDAKEVKHPYYSTSYKMENITDKQDMMVANHPISRIMSHIGHKPLEWIKFQFAIFSDYLCTATSWSVGECGKLRNSEIDEGVKFNYATDLRIKTGFWRKRRYPKATDSGTEVPWKADMIDWDVVERHILDVSLLLKTSKEYEKENPYGWKN